MSRTTVSVYLRTVTTAFQHGINQAQKKWKSFTNYLKTTQGMVLSALGVGSFRSIIDGWDKMAKNARNIGVASDYYQKLTYAADRSGVAIEQVFETLSRLKTNSGAAVTGNAEMLKLFNSIGISLEELQRLSPQDLFDRVTDALKNTTDAAVRNNAAAKILGETYNKLGVFMNDYKSLGKELEQKDGIISNETLAAAEQFNDQITDLVMALKSLVGNTGILQAVADGLLTINKIIRGEMEKEASAAADRANAAGMITRKDAVEYLLSENSPLHPITRFGFKIAGAEAWANGANDLSLGDQLIIDRALRKGGFGAFAGTWDWKIPGVWGTRYEGKEWIPMPDTSPGDILYTGKPEPPALPAAEKLVNGLSGIMFDLTEEVGHLADSIDDSPVGQLITGGEYAPAIDAVAEKIKEPALTAAGDFSAAALKQKLGLKPEERTAEATEETARIAAKIAAKMDEQGIVYAE